MTAPAYDAKWLYDAQARLSDVYGYRNDVAELIRWSNPDNPTNMLGNHAAVGPGTPLIPDQLIQAFDKQGHEGARHCIDLFGPEGDADVVCREYGMSVDPDTDNVLVTWNRATMPLPKTPTAGANRTAPPVSLIPADGWLDACTQVAGGELTDSQRETAMSEALGDNMTFFGIRVAKTFVTVLARFDHPDASQLLAFRTTPEFRKAGFGQGVTSTALQSAPTGHAFMLTFRDNNPVMALIRRFGATIHDEPAFRRYVS